MQEYRRAICIVLPSVYRTSIGTETVVPELLGQTLLEGMACEAPAICTRRGELAGNRRGRRDGFVVPPNDPAALGDRLETLRRTRNAPSDGEAARARVLERFTWDSRGAAMSRSLRRTALDMSRALLDRMISTLRPLTVSAGRGSCSIA